MSNIDHNFPIYRKTLNSRNFYCITAVNKFIEIQAVGSKWLRHESFAEILPMRLLISDLISCADGVYTECSEEDFIAMAAKVVS